jgi:hypothetical protein
MASMSMTPPKTVHCDFEGAWWEGLTAFTWVTDVEFPASSTEEVRNKVQGVEGLEYFSSPGNSEAKAFNGSGIRGWIRETSKPGKEELITLRMFTHWTSEEMEKEFNTKAMSVEDGGDILVYEKFLRDMKELGMLAIKEQHCKFTHIPQHFR